MILTAFFFRRYALLPRTEDNHAVVYHKQQNVGFFNLTDFITLLAMMLDIVIYDNSYDNPPAGLIVLFDMKGVSSIICTFCLSEKKQKIVTGLTVTSYETTIFNCKKLLNFCPGRVADQTGKSIHF